MSREAFTSFGPASSDGRLKDVDRYIIVKSVKSIEISANTQYTLELASKNVRRLIFYF